MSDAPRQSALVRIVAATRNLTAKTTYYAASLGALAYMAAGVDPSTLPPALGAFAGGIGINVLSGMIERLARGDSVNDDDILDAVQYAIKETRIADALTEAQFREALTRFTGGFTVQLIHETMEAGFDDIARRLIDQTEAVQLLELKMLNLLGTEFSALHRRLDRLEDEKQRALAPLPPQKRNLKVFISSPGDVQAERSIAAEVVKDLNFHPEFREWFFLEPLRWDDENTVLPMPMNAKAQNSVDIYLTRPSQCDIVIVVFWSKMGTEVEIDGVEYLSGTEYELRDALNAGVTTFTYRCMAEPHIGMRDPEFAEKKRQYDLVEAFFANLNPAGRFDNYYTYGEPDEFRKLLQGTLEGYLRHLKTQPVERQPAQTRDTEAEQAFAVWQRSPFPGLEAFTAKDAPIFFGRSSETNKLAINVRRSRFNAVIGASGSGKSSLVGAGLIPRLKDDDDRLRIVRFKPGEARDATGSINPFAAFYDGFAEAFPHLANDTHLRSASIRDFATDPGAAAAFCQTHARDNDLLLFIDQFEETFTLVPDSLRPLFVNMLVNLAGADGIRTVVTMRSDFQHRCLEYPQLSALLNEGAYHLPAPRLVALHEMIVKPAERAALDMEEGLAAQILEDTGSSAGALALMAYALHELYEIAVKRGDRRLSFDDYEALGRVQGAIGKRAERIFAELPGDEAEKTRRLHRVFQALVTVDDESTPTRQRATVHSLPDDAETRALIKAFVEARLLVSDGYGADRTLEVAHEALFRSWGRLATWLEQVGEDLRLLRQMRASALEWDQNARDPAFVWRDQRNKDMLAMLDRLDPQNLEDYERDFARAEAWHLLDETENIDTSHQRRQEVGVKLAVLGDPRPGVGLREDGLPDIDWVYIDVPEELRGTKIPFYQKKSNSGRVERSKYGEFALQPFYMARYPITYAQFRPFAENATVFHRDEWWQAMPRAYKKQAIKEQNNPYDNHPRDSINWYDAVAFTRWLNAMLPRPEYLPVDWEIRLPTEWEWQWAATGGQLERYPWGNEWDGRLANTSEARIAKSTAVGMYPGGQSQQGLFDMSGNVWEWCLTKYDSPEQTRVDETDVRRVLRGGSFLYDAGNSRCAFRYNYLPSLRSISIGVRVCCAPQVSL